MSNTKEKNVKIRVIAPDHVAQQTVGNSTVNIKSGIVVRGAFVMPGGVCEVPESDANDLIQRGRAELV
ncbi:MAG: hypothetical protein RL651_301 [Pseudomonadota bacterium]|jgi:hypothetical protein